MEVPSQYSAYMQWLRNQLSYNNYAQNTQSPPITAEFEIRNLATTTFSVVEIAILVNFRLKDKKFIQRRKFILTIRLSIGRADHSLNEFVFMVYLLVGVRRSLALKAH
jgi:hypothetical protein